MGKIFSMTVRDAAGREVFASKYLSVSTMFNELQVVIPGLTTELDQEKAVFGLVGAMEIYHDGYVCELAIEAITWGEA